MKTKLILFTLFFILNLSCFAKTVISINGTATTTSAKVLELNIKRTYMIIQNTGSNPIILTVNNAPVSTEGLVIGVGGNFEPALPIHNSVWLKTDSGTSDYQILVSY